MRIFRVCSIGLFLVVVVLLGGCLTGTIEGNVVDGEDRAVKGAIVTTEPPTHSVRSGENGYLLENVPVGTYSVSATKPGFVSDSVDIEVQWGVTTIGDIQILRKKQSNNQEGDQ